jgi:hypothetical protein
MLLVPPSKEPALREIPSAALKSLNKITKTRHKLHLNNSNSDNWGSGSEVTGRAAGFRRARRRPDRMADNLGRRILSSLCCFSFPSLGGALASVSTIVESLSLMHAGDLKCRLLLLLIHSINYAAKLIHTRITFQNCSQAFDPLGIH